MFTLFMYYYIITVVAFILFKAFIVNTIILDYLGIDVIQ